MDMENMSFAEIIREDILSCAVCFELLQDPRTLPCLHTYCKGCLMSMVEIKAKKGGRYIRCPECRYETRLVRPGVDDVKSSFFIRSLMEVYDTKRQVVRCTVCHTRQKERKAVSKCTTCLDGLCEECSKGHLRSTATLGHKVVPLRDFASGMYDTCLRDSQKFMCSAHDREMEFYCDTCESVGCMSCIILNHNDHAYDVIPVSYESKKDNLKSMFSEVMTKVENIAMAKSKIEELSVTIGSKGEEVLKVIADAGRAVTAAVEKEVAEAKRNAEKLIKPRQERLTTMNMDLDERLKEWRMSIEFCRKILNDGKPVEVLQIVGLLKERLAQLCQADDRTSVPEIEFNTRIMDVHINEAFKDAEKIFLGLFQPEQKLVRGVKVTDCCCQTDESMSNAVAGIGSDVSHATDNTESEQMDSGLDSQLSSMSVNDSTKVQIRENTEDNHAENADQPVTLRETSSSVKLMDVDFWSEIGVSELSTFVMKNAMLLLMFLCVLFIEERLSKFVTGNVKGMMPRNLGWLDRYNNSANLL